MQINKKIITAAITALLLLSMLAAATPAFAALDSATVTVPGTGHVGEVIAIQGVVGAATSGGEVLVYWENQAGTPLNSTYALGNGAFEIKVTIPAAVAGNHYLVIKDKESSNVYAPLFVIEPEINLSASRGIPGEGITVTGTGFGPSKNVTLSFDGTETNWAISNAVGGVTTSFTVPSIAYGAYPVSAMDNVTNAALPKTFTIGAVVTISPTQGPAGTIVTINGKGFIHSTTNTLLAILIGGVTPKNLTTMRTAADGTFTGTFIVPSSLAVQSTRYVVSANDGVDTGATSGTGSFRVTGTTKITTVASAAPGTTITLTGQNFTAQPGTVVKIDFGVLSEYATFTTNANGAFSGSMTVPYLTVGTYTVTATDANGLTSALIFKIAITSVAVTPSTAPSGTVVTVTGYGFTAGDTFNVTFAGVLVVPTGIVAAGTPTTVTATFVIPTINPNTYSVVVTDLSGLTAAAEFTVNATSTITLIPTSAPKDIAVTITATNFGAGNQLIFYIKNSTWSALLSVTPAAGFVGTTTNATGAYVGTFEVDPVAHASWALGTYTINASNINTPVNTFNATVTFTLGVAAFDVTTRAATYRQGDTISFKAQSSYPGWVEVILLDPEGNPGYVEFYLDGPINGYYVAWYYPSYYGDNFILPSDAPVGTWTWNATLGSLVTTGKFTVLKGFSDELTDIGKKLDNMNATLVAVKDNVLTIKTDTGTIKTTLEAINAKLVAIDGKVATIDSNVGQIKASISDLPSSVSASVKTSIENGMATITTSIGEVKTKLTSLEASISSISGDVVTIKSSIGDITTTLTAINTKVISIEGNVATILTDVGTLQGVVTQIKNDVATINTGVGTITTNVASLQEPVKSANDNTSSMSTMIYVAVAFAIIAAIAAVASILLMRKKIAS